MAGLEVIIWNVFLVGIGWHLVSHCWQGWDTWLAATTVFPFILIVKLAVVIRSSHHEFVFERKIMNCQAA